MNPTLQSLWMVDSVVRHEETGKLVLAGLFNQIEVAPGADYTAGAWVFFSVRGVHGSVVLNLIYVDLSDDETLLEQQFSVDGSPLETTDVAIQVNRLPVPHAGNYAWELLCGNEPLGTSRIEAALTGQEEG